MTYSTRKRTIMADDGGRVVHITVEAGVRDRALTRDEHEAMLDDVVSRIMRELPSVRYLNIPLSRVKVSR